MLNQPNPVLATPNTFIQRLNQKQDYRRLFDIKKELVIKNEKVLETKSTLLPKSSSKELNFGEGFIVEIGREGKTKVFERKAFSGLIEAESYLKGKLKGSIAASGIIKTTGGRTVEVNLGEEFTSAKREKGRVVQKAKYRLSSAGEKAQIRSFRI